MSKYLIKLGQNSKKAHKIIDTKIKNNVLKSFVKLIFKNKNKILLENLKDIRFAKKKGLKKNLVNIKPKGSDPIMYEHKDKIIISIFKF